MKAVSAATRGIAKENWHRAAIAAAFDSIAPLLQRLEDELDGKDYLVGSYSVADIAFTQIELGLGLPEKYPRIRSWVARLMQHPSYRSIAEFVSQH